MSEYSRSGSREVLRGARGIASVVIFGVFALCLVSGAATAQEGSGNRWVTDSFEITMRNGKGNRQTIVRMLPSGTRIELLESDPDEGYSRVRTGSGAEGWVLSRYLEKSPPARVAMPEVQARLRAGEEKRAAIAAELKAVTRERDQFKRQLGETEASGRGLQKDLDEVRRLSANVIKIDSQNKTLRQSLTDSQADVERLQAENQQLASRANREWFIIGALVVIVGMLIGLILPRIRWRRKSSWGDL